MTWALAASEYLVESFLMRSYLWTLTAFGEVDLKGMAVSCHSLPMFHAMGILQIGAAAGPLRHAQCPMY